jgi:transcriptional regulator with XRE-family HTH domain
MKERIQSIINHSGLTQSAFADRIGVQRSAVSHILSGRNNPGLDFLSRILESFPDISGDWLVTGKGDMLKKRQGRPILPTLQFPAGPSASDSEDAAPYITKNQEIKPENEEPAKPQAAAIDTPEPTGKPAENTNNSSKTIRQIVIFYTDNTFDAYHQS